MTVPWNSLVEGLLDGDEVGEDAAEDGGGDDHDDEPEIELGFGPMVFAPALDGDDFGGGHFVRT